MVYGELCIDASANIGLGTSSPVWLRRIACSL